MRMEARPSETSGVRGLNKTYLWAAWPAIGLDSRLVRAEGRTVWNSGTPCFNTCVHIQYFEIINNSSYLFGNYIQGMQSSHLSEASFVFR